LTENTRYYAARLNEAGATIGTFKDKLEAERAKNQRLQEEFKRQDAKIENLKSELARRSEGKSENPIAENPKIEAADLLNQLKARRKKSKTDLGDVEAILAMIDES